VIKGQYFNSPSPGPQDGLVQWELLGASSTLGVMPAARMIDQNPPDYLCAKSEEMEAILAVNPLCPN
jgi:hypothetical protein